MVIKIEKEFIQNYIKKEYQERFLYEFMKKREKLLSRFSHNSIELFRKDLLILQIKDENSILEIKEFKNVLYEECYLVSRFYDGTIMNLDVALKEAFQDLCASLIITKSFVMIKEEVEIRHPNIYILQVK